MVIQDEKPKPYIPPVESSTMTTLFLGGGAYCFQRHMQYAYPGTGVDVAEIDPAVTRANFMATGLPRDTPIKTYWGDARQFVELQPGHQAVRPGLRRRVQRLLGPLAPHHPRVQREDQEDAQSERRLHDQYHRRLRVGRGGPRKAEHEIEKNDVTDEAKQERIRQQASGQGPPLRRLPRRLDQDRQADLPPRLYLRDRRSRATDCRETFVVVASMKQLDLKDLGLRKDDPQVLHAKRTQTKPKTYGPEDEKTVIDDPLAEHHPDR